MSASATAHDVEYKVLVGMEIHVELATRSKMFTGAANVAYPGNFRGAGEGSEGGANSMVDPVVLGLPGVLPVLNKRAIEMAMMVGLALNCKIAAFTKWDRKSYYYPDLPKNYQISQYDLPLCGEGEIDLPLTDGSLKKIRIRRAHLEEDAGKLMHEGADAFSRVDLNRAGTPLLEIVTEPDLNSPEEARLFGEELRRICRYLGVTQGIMQQGHMRFEPNINLHIFHNGKTFKTPISEIKNLNSFRAVERACTYEIQSQLADWHKSGHLDSPGGKGTYGWDDEKGVTVLQRSKEEAQDYRYFPDPDLVPLDVDRAWVDHVKKEVVELPIQRRHRYIKDYGLTAKEAMALVEERKTAELFEEAIANNGNPRRIANLMLGVAAKTANEQTISSGSPTYIWNLPPAAGVYADLAKMIDGGMLSASSGVAVFNQMVARDLGKLLTSVEPLRIDYDVKQTATDLGLIQVRDAAATEKWVDEALAANPKAVETYKTNPKKKDASLGFLRGAVMKASAGKADPKMVGELLEKKLNG